MINIVCKVVYCLILVPGFPIVVGLTWLLERKNPISLRTNIWLTWVSWKECYRGRQS